ncbi:coiled-coil domain-containing protein 39-like isoform X2 [Sipha flava]|nr:coiled-coil domain-containing protein 39-like isoform X2 [Sipha flava]
MLKKKAELLMLDDSLDYDIREGKNIITNLYNQEAQNQNLIVTYRQQYETESHMLQLEQNNNEKIKQEKKEAEKQLNEMIQMLSKLESEMTKTEELIIKKRETIEWGEETLLAWNNDLAKRDMDVNLLEAYHLEDDDRFKELDLRRQQLQREVIEREATVEKEVNELLQVERELEQTAKLNRQAQQERNHLLEQWENSVNFCTSNQKYTQNIVEEINKIREAAREIYNKKKENEQKYQDYKEDNEELEYEITKIKKTNDELRRLILAKQSENENLQSEVLTAQKSLNVICNKLSNERTKRKHMQNELVKLKTQIQNKEGDIEKIKNNISELKNSSMTKEERICELNKIAENQQVKSEQLLIEKNKVINMTNSVKYEIKQLQSKIDLLTNNLDQSRTKQSVLSKEEFKLKQLIMDKKEVLYNLSFQLETLRINCAKIKGSVNLEEMHDFQEKLKTRKEELYRIEENQRQLVNQLKSVERETKRITKDIEKNTMELKTTQNRVEELFIRNAGDEKEIQSLKEKNHRYHMEEMMMKLRMEQIKKLTENECKKVYTIAQQRDEITWGINKRKAELASFYEQMKAEKKILLEEMSSAKRNLDALVQHIEQRRNKYQILLTSVGMTDDDKDDCEYDDDQSFFTISEHRIRVLQEKLELQDIGDTLDESVQNLESEIRAMENTLHVMSASNSCYKANLSSVNPASDEYKEKIVLEETIEELNGLWLQKKKTVENTKNKIKDLEDQYKTKNEELESLINLRDIYKCDLERVLKEADEQTNKFNRVNSRIQFEMKKIDKKCDPDKRNTLELIKRDIVVRMLKKMNKCVLEQMSEMSVRHIGVEPTVKQYLSEKGLELPTVSGLMLNKIKSSCGSSAMSLISSNSSIKSNSDEDRKSLYSVINLEPSPRGYLRKSDASIANKT